MPSITGNEIRVDDLKNVSENPVEETVTVYARDEKDAAIKEMLATQSDLINTAVDADVLAESKIGKQAQKRVEKETKGFTQEQKDAFLAAVARRKMQISNQSVGSTTPTPPSWEADRLAIQESLKNSRANQAAQLQAAMNKQSGMVQMPLSAPATPTKQGGIDDGRMGVNPTKLPEPVLSQELTPEQAAFVRARSGIDDGRVGINPTKLPDTTPTQQPNIDELANEMYRLRGMEAELKSRPDDKALKTKYNADMENLNGRLSANGIDPASVPGYYAAFGSYIQGENIANESTPPPADPAVSGVAETPTPQQWVNDPTQLSPSSQPLGPGEYGVESENQSARDRLRSNSAEAQKIYDEAMMPLDQLMAQQPKLEQLPAERAKFGYILNSNGQYVVNEVQAPDDYSPVIREHSNDLNTLKQIDKFISTKTRYLQETDQLPRTPAIMEDRRQLEQEIYKATIARESIMQRVGNRQPEYEKQLAKWNDYKNKVLQPMTEQYERDLNEWQTRANQNVPYLQEQDRKEQEALIKRQEEQAEHLRKIHSRLYEEREKLLNMQVDPNRFVKENKGKVFWGAFFAAMSGANPTAFVNSLIERDINEQLIPIEKQKKLLELLGMQEEDLNTQFKSDQALIESRRANYLSLLSNSLGRLGASATGQNRNNLFAMKAELDRKNAELIDKSIQTEQLATQRELKNKDKKVSVPALYTKTRMDTLPVINQVAELNDLIDQGSTGFVIRAQNVLTKLGPDMMRKVMEAGFNIRNALAGQSSNEDIIAVEKYRAARNLLKSSITKLQSGLSMTEAEIKMWEDNIPDGSETEDLLRYKLSVISNLLRDKLIPLKDAAEIEQRNDIVNLINEDLKNLLFKQKPIAPATPTPGSINPSVVPRSNDRELQIKAIDKQINELRNLPSGDSRTIKEREQKIQELARKKIALKRQK